VGAARTRHGRRHFLIQVVQVPDAHAVLEPGVHRIGHLQAAHGAAGHAAAGARAPARRALRAQGGGRALVRVAARRADDRDLGAWG
jgi:hypothetical protein